MTSSSDNEANIASNSEDEMDTSAEIIENFANNSEDYMRAE